MKKNLKKGFEITTFSLVEYNKYAKFAEVKILKVDSKKLIKLIKKDLKALGGEEITLADSKIGQDVANERVSDELKRRLKLTLGQIEACETLEDLAEFDYSNKDLQKAIDKKTEELGGESEDEDTEDEEDTDNSEEDSTDETDTTGEETTGDEDKGTKSTEEDDPFEDDVETKK
ncbi:MAG: hypothetical protein ACTSRG_14640 [Candidatus Helarchaeota archaeon]